MPASDGHTLQSALPVLGMPHKPAAEELHTVAHTFVARKLAAAGIVDTVVRSQYWQRLQLGSRTVHRRLDVQLPLLDRHLE